MNLRKEIGMTKKVFFSWIGIVTICMFMVTSSVVSSTPIVNPEELTKLQQEASGPVNVTWDPAKQVATFVQADVSIAGGLSGSSLSQEFLTRFGEILGINDPTSELELVSSEVDSLGITRVKYQQIYHGVEVYDAQVSVYLAPVEGSVIASSSGFVPGIVLGSTVPNILNQQALETAQKILPGGTVLVAPKLVVYPAGETAVLAWVVELVDDSIPARNLYVMDAQKGTMIGTLDKLADGRNRSTYNAYNSTQLPGTLVRSENTSQIGNADVDNAHDFAGATYDYYWNKFGRDSYDNQGATLIATAHYGNNYKNAFWDGTQMVYGESFPVKDVVAHELTHAVTEKTANLEYKWQSGALNESFSDIFGVMVDRDDWLLGEDLPSSVLGGQRAIRSMSNPGEFGQPAHTKDWVNTCSDSEGVHTNSGIFNKAYYNIAITTSKEVAEKIFYRTLTVYLNSSSSFENARASVLQSTRDLYSGNATIYNAVVKGFNDVGLDGSWNPSSNNCICGALTALNSQPGSSALDTAITLYRVRDQLMPASKAGQRYRKLYESNTGRISLLMLSNPDLRAKGLLVLQQVTPGLRSLVDGIGDQEIVTAQTVENMKSYLVELAAEDRAKNDGKLAIRIEAEMKRIPWDQLVGKTYAEAQIIIETNSSFDSVIFVPGVFR
jgi:Zn-dependent metalloprotease